MINMLFVRFVRRFILSPEALLMSTITILIYAYIFHGFKIWTIFRSFRPKQSTSQDGMRNIRSTTGLFAKSAFSKDATKAFWEVKKDNMAVYSIQGERLHMEDRFNYVSNFENTGVSMYGVFDGHGGEFAADFVEKLLFHAIMTKLVKANGITKSGNLNFSSLLTDEILKVDQQLLSLEHANKDASGTTAVVAMHQDHILTVANVGDSRAVLCDSHGKAIPLSYDHKPQQLKERQRIKEAGGFISFNGVWRVAGILATSRALGDYPLKEDKLVIANPDTLTFDLRDHNPQFMIIASDGLWDTFSNEDAVTFVKQRLDEPLFGAKSLTLESYRRGSLDNITVMVVKFINESGAKKSE